MNILQTFILGAIEGFTEFLPISSTGHLILASKILNLNQTEFLKSFEIVIQSGAILAVVFLYRKTIFFKKEIIKRMAVAFLPTAIGGFLLYKVFKSFLLQNTKATLLSLFFGGILLIVFEVFHKEKGNTLEEIPDIPYLKCFLIGVFQIFAIIPGVSRAAATIIGGLAVGIKRKTIVEFSFLLAIPTMLAASFFDLSKSATGFSLNNMTLLAVGFLVSFFTAILSVKFLLGFIKKQNFTPFGIYRVILAIIFYFFV